MGFGGSSSSGRHDYPTYMMDEHLIWMSEFGALTPATNPYTGLLTYNPTSIVNTLSASLTAFVNYFTSIGTTLSGFKTMWSERLIAASQGITGPAAVSLDFSRVFYFEGEMRDINAVQTSSFPLGRAKIYSDILVEMGELILGNTNDAINSIIEYGKQLRSQFILQMDYSRVLIIAYKDRLNYQTEIDAEEAKWPFFEFREAGALLGSIAGVAGVQPLTTIKKPDPTLSIVGGAISGAVTGAYIGSSWPPYGTAIGAVVGAIIGGVGAYLTQ